MKSEQEIKEAHDLIKKFLNGRVLPADPTVFNEIVGALRCMCWILHENSAGTTDMEIDLAMVKSAVELGENLSRKPSELEVRISQVFQRYLDDTIAKGFDKPAKNPSRDN